MSSSISKDEEEDEEFARRSNAWIRSLVQDNNWQQLNLYLSQASPSLKVLNAPMDKYSSTLLHYAAGAGALETCRRVLLLLRTTSTTTTTTWNNNCQVTPLRKSSKNGRTALHWAARNGHTEICRLLVSFTNTDVDVEAKGQVTPLQLAIWQAHLTTSKTLNELGANPHYINGWGCGVAHWLAKSPHFGNLLLGIEEQQREQQQQQQREKDPSHAMSSFCLQNDGHLPASYPITAEIKQSIEDIFGRTTACCHWLFDTCQVPFENANDHGQTPVHKAAFSGNMPMLCYLVYQKKVLDAIRDHQGNTAADCAERSQQYAVARWLRRYASPLLQSAIDSICQWRRKDDILSTTTTTTITTMPSLEELHTLFQTAAKALHPDRQRRPGSTSKLNTTIVATADKDDSHNQEWHLLLKNYRLLVHWWESPELYDCQIRLASRNAALLDYPAIKWLPEWHDASQTSTTCTSSDCSAGSETIGEATAEARLQDFERRLVRLLTTKAHKENGLTLAQLPKEYQKNFPHDHDNGVTRKPKGSSSLLPVTPRDYQCKNLSQLIEQECPHLVISRDPAGTVRVLYRMQPIEQQ